MQSSTSHSGKCQQVGENGSAAAFPTPSPKRLRVSNPSHPTTTTNDDSTYDFDNEEEEWETASLHYLKATLVGVYCASCTHQPLLKKRGSNLFLAHSTDILSVADFVLKNAPFLSFVRLKNAPLVLKNAPFVCSRMPLFYFLLILWSTLERMKRVRGGTNFYLYCGVLEPKKRVRGGTLIKAVLKRSTKEQGRTFFGGG